MCTLLFAFKAHPKYDFIFLGNRDEFKKRPSQKAHFWQSDPRVLAGMDLEKGGTWTGMTTEGRIAFITNHRDFTKQRTSTLSRGFLTQAFLTGAIPPEEYLQAIQPQHGDYNPFNLVIGTLEELWFYSNIENKIRQLQPGIYGLSNALLDTPWFKVNKAKNRFTQLLDTDFTADQLFDILDDTEIAPDEALPQTGVPLETERMLSSIHIDTPTYGTLFKTVILITPEGAVQFHEKALDDKGQWTLSTESFVCKA